MRAVIFLCLLGWVVAAEALTLKCKRCRAASPETTRQRRSNWNPLSTDLNVKGNNDESKLNATATAPLNGSNSTTNSSTAAEQTNPPSGNEKTKEHQAAAPNAAPPIPEPTKQTHHNIWHPLQSGGSFKFKKSKEQAPNAAPPIPEPTKQTHHNI